MGTIIRTAISFGIKNIICIKGTVDAYSSKVVRSTMGAIEKVNIYYLTYDELKDIPDIGETIAKTVVEYFENSKNQDLISELKELGLNMEYLGKVLENEKIKDKSFVITGTLNIKRDELKEKITTSGGKVIESVSKKTDYLVLGENPGSKYDKAVKLGITILYEEEILDLLGEK